MTEQHDGEPAAGRLIEFPHTDTSGDAVQSPASGGVGGPRPLEGVVMRGAPAGRLARNARVVRDGTVRAGRATAPYVGSVSRAGVRHGSYIAGGLRHTIRGAWRRRNHEDLAEAIRTARASGELHLIADLEQRRRDAVEARRKQFHARVRFAGRAAWIAVLAAGMVTALVALWAYVAEFLPGGLGFDDVWTRGYWALLTTVGGAGVWLWSHALWILTGIAGVALLALWRTGVDHDTAPAWSVSPGAPRRKVAHEADPVTPSAVVTALRNLGIAGLTRAVKDSPDAGAELVGPITLAGCGVEFGIHLPRGVATHEVEAKHKKLAENLDRHEHEVFLSIPERARSVTVWVADSGALDEPIGASPLELDEEATADYYTGRAPWGQDLRGDAVTVQLLQMHLLITGLSNQGKTAALRALVLWLLRDITVETHIADLKGIGDWRMFNGIAATLIEGPSDAHVIRATEMLEWGVALMNDRLEGFDADKHPNGVTRELARKAGSGYHPVVFIVDEAQVAFMCPELDDNKVPYGGKKHTSRFFRAARQIQNQGRAVNVTLWQGTQDPTDENLPKIIREGAHIRASLVVGTESQAAMALGDKAVNAGAAPHKLRQGKDKGTVVATGEGIPLAQGQSSLTVRTHFVDGAGANRLGDKIRARRGAITSADGVAPEQRNLLADVLEAMRGEEAVSAADVAVRLRELAPKHRPYSNATGKLLKQWLVTYGVNARMAQGTPTVRAEHVRQVLADWVSEQSEPAVTPSAEG